MNNSNRNILIGVVLLIVIGVLVWYFAGAGVATGKTVATVNGTPITEAQLVSEEAQIAAQLGATTTPASTFQTDALNELIGTELLKQAAMKAGITASSTLVDQKLASTKAQFSSTQAYEQALSAQDMTEASLRQQIADSIQISAFLNQQLNLNAATATPAQIQQAYTQQAATMQNPPPLAQVKSEVAQAVVAQEQQRMIAAYVSQLRQSATVDILIATSTPAAATPPVTTGTTAAAPTSTGTTMPKSH